MSSSFIHSDLYVEITNMYDLCRETDHNLSFVAYGWYTTEIMKVQEWILVELRIADRQR